MHKVQLGNSNYQASAVALGVMRMNALSVPEAATVLDTIKDVGINYIDSADIYGAGDSERVLGQALKRAGANRNDFFIQSKVGIVQSKGDSPLGAAPYGGRYDFSKRHILEAVDGVLERLQIDYLDALLLHRPDPLMEIDEVAAAFDELLASGKVRHFGVSNFNPRQVDLLQSVVNQKLLINQLQFGVMHTGPITFGMHTNMTDDGSINRDGGVIEYSRLHKMTIQTWSPFQYGQIEGTFINNPAFPEVNRVLDVAAKKHGVSKNAIATAWILRHPAHMQVIIGTMNPDHIRDSAAGADVDLTRQEWYDIYYAAGNDMP
ncbi:aldo/keto reductase [Lacticaseibacillus thailandensis]|uniref:Oxidoreductase n=1 Tax=Lacticaseibacillus thailandensis DSM 22698 = JCM 13996 TaxID=1423810 RepID=A0A0R2C711_9LACO|nr:aldo/keto reductase [Lacticaseibacillus thailandensis]KRM87502.1 oxidoreductase [Lacticaseibacillus thailandensis DSM 22698 = JCM 13996]